MAWLGDGRTQSYYVAHVDLRILGSSNPPVSASKCVGITGMSHCTQPDIFTIIYIIIILASGEVGRDATKIKEKQHFQRETFPGDGVRAFSAAIVVTVLIFKSERSK
ncbi:hypothetical protein AAY473_027381 [Plecturocebus cupreus]